MATLALAAAVRSTVAAGPAGVSYTSGSYTQDFETLFAPSPDGFTTLLDSSFASTIPLVPLLTSKGAANVGIPINLSGTSNGTPSINVSSMTGWYTENFGGNSSALQYNYDDGSHSNVALTAYFDPTQPNKNISLGALTSSTSGNVVFGVKLVNNTGGDLNAISVGYLGELFHQDTGAKVLSFGYAIDNTNNTTIPISGLTLYGGLNVGGFATGLAGAASNPTANAKTYNATDLPLNTTWKSGSSLWLTWTMNTAGGGQGLAIDNLSFSASNVAIASALTWATGNGTWDSSNTVSWSNGTAFGTNAHNAVFGDAASNITVAIAPGGVVVPNSITINNSNPNTTYTFTGGPITSTSAGTSVNISGNGTVVFTSPQQYTFQTNLNGGTLVVSNDNQLGLAAAINFNGGTLSLAGNIDSSNRSLVVTSAGGVINTNGNTISFGGSSSVITSITGQLEVAGGGNVNLGIQPTFGNAAAPAGSLKIDTGSSVTINGYGRANPSDIYANTTINGQLILATTPFNLNVPFGGRFNFDSVGANGNTRITGTGKIVVTTGSAWLNAPTTNINGITVNHWNLDGSGVVISNTSAQFAAEIDTDILLNPLVDSDPANHTYTRINVATANFLDSAPIVNGTAFTTVVGGTKIGTQGHGPTFSNLVIAGNITGHSDLSIGNDYKSGGSGDVTLLGTGNNWHGALMINGGGTLYTGVPNALPTDTDVIFGSLDGAGAGFLDLSGNNQHIHSIEVSASSSAKLSVMINNSGATPATLFITGDVTPFYPYTGLLNDGGQAASGANGTSSLALDKSGLSTLALGFYAYSGSKSNSTYSGGTTIHNGAIQVEFDGALGAANGTLTFDGGTLNVQDADFPGGPSNATERFSTVQFNRARPLSVTSSGGTIVTPNFTATLTSNATVSGVEPVIFSGAGGYNWGGKLQFSGDVGSTLTINGGAGNVTVTGNAALQANANTTVLVGGASDPFTSTANPTAHVAIISNGAVEFTTGSKAVAAISGTGSVQVDADATLTSDGAQVSTLIINGSHAIRSNATAAGTSKVGTLTLAGATDNWTGHLDLSGNKLIVETASKATAIATLQNQVAYGAGHSGGVNSTGLPANFGIAVMDNAVLNKSTFGGLTVDANSVLVSAEILGDSNADGNVDLTDLSAVLNNFGSTTSAWTSGNFDGAATIDLTDLSDVLNNFGANNPNASFLPPAVALGGGSIAATPEPTSLALVGAGAVALLRRRKRA